MNKATTQPGGASAAPEAPIWEDTPSQWVNVLPFLSCLLVVPIPWAVYRWLATRCTNYRLTTQRLRFSHGILNRQVDDLELYRVKDITVAQPLLLRMVGLGNLTLVTSDATTPTLPIPAIKDPLHVKDLLRERVEHLRRERGVRELDVHDDDSQGAFA